MTPIALDPRLTFDNFVVGQANRLTAAAGRRVAEIPGAAYNPLFIYGGSGVGKTHLLNAIGHHAHRLHPNLNVVSDTLNQFLDDLLQVVRSGNKTALQARLQKIDFLLLDDVQFLGDRRAEQEELLRAWDAITSRGGQVVMASDRPPTEIQGLDQRVVTRFSGGLIADMGSPDYETRVAIVRRKAADRHQDLGAGVAEALAKIQFENVRELQGALNKLLALQDIDGREVGAGEIAAMFGKQRAQPAVDEFSGFLSDIVGTVAEVVTQTIADTKLSQAILRWKAEGFSTRRLEAALAKPPAEEELDAFIQQYESDVERIREIEREIRSIEPHAPELARPDMFRLPDRLADAEELLHIVRERNRPLPAPPPGRSFETSSLLADTFALRAAKAIADKPGEQYNPFFVYGPEGKGKTTLLAALANEIQERTPNKPVAFVHGKHFATEVIEAIQRNSVESWRDRYTEACLFVLDDIDALVGTERAQEELFHLFEALKRNGAQLAFGGERPPHDYAELDDRLRTRLESGLVVSIEERSTEAPLFDAETRRREWLAAIEATASTSQGESEVDDWFKSHEKVLWKWPYLEDWLIEEVT